MPVLSNSDREAVTAEFNNRVTAEGLGEIVGLTRQNVRAAVNALDAHFNADEGQANSAIPQPARSALTPQQREYLKRLIVAKRVEAV